MATLPQSMFSEMLKDPQILNSLHNDVPKSLVFETLKGSYRSRSGTRSWVSLPIAEKPVEKPLTYGLLETRVIAQTILTESSISILQRQMAQRLAEDSARWLTALAYSALTPAVSRRPSNSGVISLRVP